jgi:hypothetical protein
MTDRLLSASTSLPGLLIRKPPKVSMHGDSIGNFMAQFSCNAPTFWQQVYKPRNFRMFRDGANLAAFDSGSGGASVEYGGNFAVSGSLSGQLWTGAGRTGTQLRATGANDLADATRLARVAAYAPDIMFIEIATNENLATYTTAAADATILNVKELIAANPNPLKQVVFCSVYPRNGPMYSHVKNYMDWARHMARAYAGYHYVDFASFVVDDTDATNYKWLSGLSADNLHPGTPSALKSWVALDALWGQLGVRQRQPKPVYQQDIYSATNPGGNLLGTRGCMAGTATALSGVTAAAGNKPSSMNTTSNGPQSATGDTTNVLFTWSLGSFTDDRGVVHTAAICDITNTGTVLTGNTVHSFKIGMPTVPTVFSNLMVHAQAVIQHQNLVGITSLSMAISADAGSNNNIVNFGGAGQSGNLFPTVATPETLYYISPWESNSIGTAAHSMTITVSSPAGALPSGRFYIGSCGLWFDLPNAYD